MISPGWIPKNAHAGPGELAGAVAYSPSNRHQSQGVPLALPFTPQPPQFRRLGLCLCPGLESESGSISVWSLGLELGSQTYGSDPLGGLTAS